MATITRGVIFVHSATRAMCPHIEWAARNVLGSRATFDWTDQPAGTGLLRTEVAWQGTPGTGARLASALRVVFGWFSRVQNAAPEGLRLLEQGSVRRVEKSADRLEVDAHSNFGSRFSRKARWASLKFGLCMQMA